MDTYKVLAEGWLEDARGNGALRKKGEKVDLTADQASYLLVSEQIEKIAPAPTPETAPAGKPGKKPD